MAFKSMKEYNDERFNGLFLLRNDGDAADVIFMYPDITSVLVANTHYIKSGNYSGYVHCNQPGCPACAKGIRVQSKLFIPLYNINTGKVEFWDRGIKFENQLNRDVFDKYPNPADYVFRITRHGEAGSVDTFYEIIAVGRNTFKSYAQIMSENGLKFPDFYESVCRDIPAPELSSMLVTNSEPVGDYTGGVNYQVTPRNETMLSDLDKAAEVAGIKSEVPELPDEEIKPLEDEDVAF